MQRNKKISVGAFTLVELLVVMGIIILLMGLVFPVVMKARHYGDRVKTRELVYQIHTAWKAYSIDYNGFPDVSIVEMDTNAMNILMGLTYNEEGKVYLDFTTEERTNGVRDVWGNLIKVSLDNGFNGDTAYDGKVVAGGYGEIPREIAVWSTGDDGLDSTESEQRDDIRSWD